MTEEATGAEDDADAEDEADARDEAAPGGLAVLALVGAAGAWAGYRLGGADGAAAGAGAVPYVTALLHRSAGEWWADRTRRAEKMMEAAGEVTGLPPGQLADLAGRSERTRHLTDVAIQAATDTFWPPTVRAIGRAFAAGLLANDEAEVDLRQHALEVMADLDRLHVTLLELLVKYEPDIRHDGIRATLHRVPSYVNTFLGGDRPDNPKVWSVGRRKWTAPQIRAVRPKLQPVLPSLLGALQQHGLADQNDTVPDALKKLSDDLAQQVNRQAGQMQRGQQMEPITLQQPTIRRVEPIWSPTDLGEKVLGFYGEAGAEDGQPLS
jgi:hypothetical protein